jgi:hypothetical protein
MDMTGQATGPHLHWSVLKNGRYTDPANYVAGSPRRSSSDPAAAPGSGDPTTGGVAAVCEDQFVAITQVGEPVAFVIESNDGGGGGPETCAA